jgi:hypothetical protein
MTGKVFNEVETRSNMPGCLSLLKPGQQNRFQGNHIVVRQGQGFKPANNLY